MIDAETLRGIVQRKREADALGADAPADKQAMLSFIEEQMLQEVFHNTMYVLGRVTLNWWRPVSDATVASVLPELRQLGYRVALVSKSDQCVCITIAWEK